MSESVYPPIRGRAFDLYFEVPKDDGTIIANPGGLAATADADGQAIPLRTVRVVNALTGNCLAHLPADVMTAAVIRFKATSTDSGALPYTEKIHTSAQTLDTMHSRTARRRGWR